MPRGTAAATHLPPPRARARSPCISPSTRCSLASSSSGGRSGSGSAAARCSWPGEVTAAPAPRAPSGPHRCRSRPAASCPSRFVSPGPPSRRRREGLPPFPDRRDHRRRRRRTSSSGKTASVFPATTTRGASQSPRLNRRHGLRRREAAASVRGWARTQSRSERERKVRRAPAPGGGSGPPRTAPPKTAKARRCPRSPPPSPPPTTTPPSRPPRPRRRPPGPPAPGSAGPRPGPRPRPAPRSPSLGLPSRAGPPVRRGFGLARIVLASGGSAPGAWERPTLGSQGHQLELMRVVSLSRLRGNPPPLRQPVRSECAILHHPTRARPPSPRFPATAPPSLPSVLGALTGMKDLRMFDNTITSLPSELGAGSLQREQTAAWGRRRSTWTDGRRSTKCGRGSHS